MKYALCNEVFRHLPLEDGFQLIADIGYDGVEIAPFTLCNPHEFSEGEADRCIAAAQAANIEIVGLHWLLAETTGLHVTHTDPEIRKKTTEFLKKLTRLTAHMSGSVMVLGSPQQRDLLPGTLYETAFCNGVEVIREVCELADKLGVILALEPLSTAETGFLCSAAETRRFMAAVNRPSARLHLDMKAMAHEQAGPVATIYEHRHEVAHFHANDVNQRGPGQGPTKLQPVIDALIDVEYNGWISVEPFDYHPTPEDCARISLRNLQEASPAVQSSADYRFSAKSRSPES